MGRVGELPRTTARCVMDTVWLVLAFATGGSVGYVVFAMMRISRGATRTPRSKEKPVLHPFEFEGDTVTRS